MERLDCLSDLTRSFQYSIVASDQITPTYPRRYNHRGFISFDPVTETNQTFARWSAEYEVSASKAVEVEHSLGAIVFIPNLKALELLAKATAAASAASAASGGAVTGTATATTTTAGTGSGGAKFSHNK